jgi:hypothetical protein
MSRLSVGTSVRPFLKTNQQSQYSVFHKLMCWHSLTFRLPNVISPLQISYTVLQVGWGGLIPKFYELPRPWSPWGSSPIREKVAMVEPEIEPGTS